MLKASMRNWKYLLSVTVNCLMTDASKLLMPSERRLPKVVGMVRRWNWNCCDDAVAKWEVSKAAPFTCRGSTFVTGNIVAASGTPLTVGHAPETVLTAHSG